MQLPGKEGEGMSLLGILKWFVKFNQNHNAAILELIIGLYCSHGAKKGKIDENMKVLE
jgi:hypothetical protein